MMYYAEKLKRLRSENGSLLEFKTEGTQRRSSAAVFTASSQQDYAGALSIRKPQQSQALHAPIRARAEGVQDNRE
jgi:hypothetical protein